MDHVIGYGVRGVIKSIAITSEVIAGQKKKSPATTDASSPPLSSIERRASDDGEDEDFTAREQDLDEIHDDEPPPYTATAPVHGSAVAPPAQNEDEEAIFERFLHAHEHALQLQPAFAPWPLPKTILLPQRRPHDRRRGFVRAYAPSLGECSGIDQTTFIDFITDWDKAARASPVFDVLNLASFAVGLVPDTVRPLLPSSPLHTVAPQRARLF